MDTATNRLSLTTRRDVEPTISVELSACTSIPGYVEITGQLEFGWGRDPRIEVEGIRAVELPSVADWSTAVDPGGQGWVAEDARAALEAFHELVTADTALATGGHTDRYGRAALHIDVVSVSHEIARWADALPEGMVDLRAAVVPA